MWSYYAVMNCIYKESVWKAFIVAINVVLPICLLIVVGYISKQLKWVSVDAYKQMNKVVFKSYGINEKYH